MIKKVAGLFLLLGIIIGSVYYAPLIQYGLIQAKGQLTVLWEARPIQDYLEDDTFSKGLKDRILFIQEVKNFAHDSLKLTLGKHYTTLYDQQGKDILWNVTACQPYVLEAYKWTFPLLGSVSYKGFFNLDMAKAEEKKLADLGYDTNIRPVNAWSTLGWFNDPILSNMLHRSDGALAELIIHELTHATIFVKDSITFNENLASFIGEKGAEAFLSYKYGSDSNALMAYQNNERDYRKYIDHMIRGSEVLDSVYRRIQDLPLKEKEAVKQTVISGIVEKLDTISFANLERFQGLYQDVLPNNTRFMSFKRYHGQHELLEDIYLNNFGASIKAYILHLKDQYGKK